MIQLSKSFFLFGRVTKKIFETADPYTNRGPGFQLVAAAPELPKALIKMAELGVSMDVSDTLNYWGRYGGVEEGLWTFGALEDGYYFLAKTVILVDKEYLDKDGRQAGVTHVVCLSPQDMNYIDNNPFLLIDSEVPLFISSIEDILDLVNPSSDLSENSLSQVFFRNKASEDFALLVEEDGSYSPKELMQLVRYLAQNEQVININGSTSETLDFLRTLFQLSHEDYRKHLTFSMLCLRERKLKVRFQGGAKSYSAVSIDAESRKVNIPSTLSKDSFFFEPATSSPLTSVSDLTSYLIAHQKFRDLLAKTRVTEDEISDIDESQITKVVQENASQFTSTILEKLSEIISPDLANQMADYLHKSAFDDADRLFYFLICRNSRHMPATFIDLIYDFLVFNYPRLTHLVDRPSWKSLTAVAQQINHRRLSFLLTTVGYLPERQRVALMEEMPPEEFQKILADFRILPPTVFVCNRHADFLLRNLQRERYSDNELTNTLVAASKFGPLTVDAEFSERIKRMNPKLQKMLPKGIQLSVAENT
jgi:hypothetical protein